jgi:hypothetical protein
MTHMMSWKIACFMVVMMILSLTLGCSKEPSIQTETVEEKGQSEPPMMMSEVLPPNHPPISGDALVVPASGEVVPEIPSPFEALPGYRVARATARNGEQTAFFQVPQDWVETEVQSSMRLYQVSIPSVSGENFQGDLAVFGQIGGSIQQNIDRWVGQFSQPDGSPSGDKAKVETIQGDHYKINLLDLVGTMGSSMMSGMPGQQADKVDWRVLGAVIETDSGLWYIKVTGHRDTLEKGREGFIALCKSFVIK